MAALYIRSKGTRKRPSISTLRPNLLHWHLTLYPHQPSTSIALHALNPISRIVYEPTESNSKTFYPAAELNLTLARFSTPNRVVNPCEGCVPGTKYWDGPSA